MPFKIGFEFDFAREADAMERIRHFLYKNNTKSPVLVPRLLPDMVTRYSFCLWVVIFYKWKLGLCMAIK